MRHFLCPLALVATVLALAVSLGAKTAAIHGDKDIEKHLARLECADCHGGPGDLDCGDCHSAFGPGGGYDFAAEGYTPLGTSAVICAQCHGERTFRGFAQDHAIHVGKKFDCGWCHAFTRPERNLKTPPNYHAPENELTVSSVKLKISTTKPDADSFSITGRLALTDPDVDLSSTAILVQWAGLGYPIPSGAAVRKGTANVFTLKSPKGVLPTLSATFDLVKMSYKISIKKASIGDQGDPVDFRLAFGTFDETVSVDIP